MRQQVNFKKSFLIANLNFDEKGCLLVILQYGEQHSTAKLTDFDVHEFGGLKRLYVHCLGYLWM